MTIFSRIIAGEIPSYKIAENDLFFAFLDIFPLREGHVLVVPKTEVSAPRWTTSWTGPSRKKHARR